MKDDQWKKDTRQTLLNIRSRAKITFGELFNLYDSIVFPKTDKECGRVMPKLK